MNDAHMGRSNAIVPAMLLLATAACLMAPPVNLCASGGEKPPAQEPVIRSLNDLLQELRASGGKVAPGSLAARLGPASEAATTFTHLTPEKQANSDLLTEHSRSLPDESVGRRALARLQKLRQESWYSQIVDVRFADDVLATVFVVYVPKPAQNVKVAEAVYLIRQGDQWRVALDPEAEVPATLGEPGKRLLGKLGAASQERLKELSGVVAEPLKGTVPFSGTWNAHFRQSDVYLTFMDKGEVFMLQVHGNGTTSYALLDFHLSKEEIVIETQRGTIRLRRDRERYWEHDGQRHYGLITDDGRSWFPEYDKPMYLKPIYKGDWPVRRPVPAKK